MMTFLTFLYIPILTISASMGTGIARLHKPKFPIVTIIVASVLASVFLLQIAFPHSLLVFERDAHAVLNGEWWRLFTALFFQDSGIIGGFLNIISLLIIGMIAERLLTKTQWLIIFFATGIVTEYFALLWQPIGAGNSIATFGLAASLVHLTLIEEGFPLIWFGAFAIMIACAELLIHRDIHGAAFCIGIVISLIIHVAYLGFHYLSKDIEHVEKSTVL